MVRIKAIIFDMDGVLIDAREWHYEALNRALGLFGYSISRVDHLTTYDGLSTKQKLGMLTVERGLPIGLHDFINEMKQNYTQELVQLKCRPSFAHEYALSKLKGMGFILGVASNSIRATVDLMMAKSGLANYLEMTLSNQDVSKAKPDPQIYHTAAKRLGLTPGDCLVVEDNPHGIRAARDSGAHVMVVRSPEDVFLDNILEHLRKIERENP
jgi:HAD superfamily hydrolase (TIGR01509 family)